MPFTFPTFPTIRAEAAAERMDENEEARCREELAEIAWDNYVAGAQPLPGSWKHSALECVRDYVAEAAGDHIEALLRGGDWATAAKADLRRNAVGYCAALLSDDYVRSEM